MRCQKCGFIGFDHLSVCSACGDDVSTSRDKLGFLSSRPQSPCFLGALLKDYQGGSSMPLSEPPKVDPLLSSLPQIELGEEFELGGESPDFELPDPTPAVPSVAKPPADVAQDLIDGAMMIDLSDDDLNPGNDGNAAGEVELDLDFLLEGDSPAEQGTVTAFGSTDKKNGKSAGSMFDMPISGPDSASLELTDDDLDQITSESEAAVNFNGPSSEAPSQDFGNMVLDLSDDDLHNLISDLE